MNSHPDLQGSTQAHDDGAFKLIANVTKQERERAHALVMGERRRIVESWPASAERMRVVNLLARIARRITG